MKNNCLLECCVDSAASAAEAAAGGADRLELCSGLVIGGITPSVSLLEQIKNRSSIPVYPLIRPRFGDFLYTEDEFEQMCADIRRLREAGADGFVIGALNADGTLNTDGLSRLMEACGGLPTTLHRAFDMCRSASEALETSQKLGISTILTSGQKNTCMEGLTLLKELHEQSASMGGAVQIMAGSGVNAGVIRTLRRETDIAVFHMSGKKVIESGMRYRNPDVSMGAASLDEYAIWQTDAEEIRKAKLALSDPSVPG